MRNLFKVLVLALPCVFFAEHAAASTDYGSVAITANNQPVTHLSSSTVTSTSQTFKFNIASPTCSGGTSIPIQMVFTPASGQNHTVKEATCAGNAGDYWSCPNSGKLSCTPNSTGGTICSTTLSLKYSEPACTDFALKLELN